MKPVGVVILVSILVFFALEVFTLIRAIKDKNKLKKGGNQNGSNCDDRNSNSRSNH